MDKPIPDLITVEAARDTHRWVAMTALLLAIGVILHTISPNVGGVTPNWTIAMYSITICLTKPGLTRALGIGFVAGLTLVPSSKSAFPLGNIASEVSGALTVCILVKAFALTHLENLKVKPFIVGFVATSVSGAVFTYILKLVLGLPLTVWTHAMLPVVFTVGALNGVVTQVLFSPVRKIFYATEGKHHE